MKTWETWKSAKQSSGIWYLNILITSSLQKGKITFLPLKLPFCLFHECFISQLANFWMTRVLCLTHCFCMWNTAFLYYKMKMRLICWCDLEDYIAYRNNRKTSNMSLVSVVTFEKGYVQHASLSGCWVMPCLKTSWIQSAVCLP